MSSTHIRKSKFLSLILRHKPDTIGLVLDENGWADVQYLCEAGNYTLEELDEIVEDNNKQRFEFNSDRSKIRARQGHSIDVDVELTEVVPPDRLFHGTSENNITSIQNQGLKSMSRLHVHMTDDTQSAIKSGKRYGIPFVVTIDAKAMYSDGIKIYRSNNGVYLTEYVDIKYTNLYTKDKAYIKLQASNVDGGMPTINKPNIGAVALNVDGFDVNIEAFGSIDSSYQRLKQSVIQISSGSQRWRGTIIDFLNLVK